MITALLTTAVACLSHNYGDAGRYVVTSDNCKAARQVVHQDKDGLIFVRPTKGWRFVTQTTDNSTWVGAYARQGETLTIIGRYDRG